MTFHCLCFGNTTVSWYSPSNKSLFPSRPLPDRSPRYHRDSPHLPLISPESALLVSNSTLTLPDLTLSQKWVLVHQHSLLRLHSHDTGILVMNPSVPYPIHLQELLHTSPSNCCHHNTDMNLNKNSSFGEGERSKTPIYNPTLSSLWQDLMNHVREGPDCGDMAPHITTGPSSAEAKALRLLNDSLTLHSCFFHV